MLPKIEVVVKIPVSYIYKKKYTMSLPTKEAAETLLKENVTNEYQLYHAKMVAIAMEGYAEKLGHDPHLWYLTGYLHDIDYEKFPETHPKESLGWFKEWAYPDDFIHAIEAHAYSYNGFTTKPNSILAAALLACDEISGLYYAYKKINPIPYGEMKVKSIRKRFKEKAFAAKIDRDVIMLGVDAMGIELADHIANLISFFKKLD